jgi:phosphate transport system substrate-binding protein
MSSFGRHLLVTVLCLTAAAACGKGPQVDEQTGAASDTAGSATAGSGLTGTVKGDGSSTVFPIMEAVSEEFQKENPNVRVTMGISGTGGGFKKFCAGETDISNASRPIKPTEVEECQTNGVEYVEIPIAFDGLSVMVNPGNDFVSCLKVEELKKLWQPEAQGKVTNWSQVRRGWPDRKIGLYGAGTDSGTYDYFTEAIVGKEGASRGDFTPSEDDNVLVQGISGDPNGLGFFGFAYYEENKDKLKLVQVDGGQGCVAPSPQTISDGTYQPLSRPLFVYIRTTAMQRPEVKAFVDYTITNAPNLVGEAGYVPLPDEIYLLARERVAKGITGSIFAGKGSQVGVRLRDLLQEEKGSTQGGAPGAPADTAAAPAA